MGELSFGASSTGYTVAAKTGSTAQVSEPGQGNCLCQYGSSYIGIAPADNPQLVVAVNIQDPRGKYYGDQVAGMKPSTRS